MGQFSLRRHPVIAGACVYLLAVTAINVAVVTGVRRETVQINGPEGKPCLGTVWTPRAPKAVIVLGHGVTANRAVMATAADVFTRNGYAVVTLDFWGHGRSRERFNWASNGAQVNAWCDWAKSQFAGLPVAYLGHSMGGEAGDAAFRDKPNVDAFVSLGMLPRRIPACKTLIAMGRFEELFSVDAARQLAQGQAEVLVSPYSDHMLEPADPVLLQGIIAWVNAALGLDAPITFPWIRWAIMLLATVLGCAGALTLAEQATALCGTAALGCGCVIPRSTDTAEGGCATFPATPPGRFNLFRIAAWALGCKGNSVPPRSGTFLSAVVRGLVFSAVLVLLVFWILNSDIYTCDLNHPERCLMWLALSPIMTLLFSVTARALERIPLNTAFQRFAVGALTRAVPLLVLCLILQLLGPGIAFAGMMLGILALVFILMSAIHALATRGAGDYRSGAVACGIVLAWITAFWIPLFWV